jgi:hypothetical protein
MQFFNPSSNEDFMKTLTRSLTLCATIAAMNALYADTIYHYATMSDETTTQPEPPRYPMIEKHAPDAIKKFCEKYKDCPECDIMEKMFWCTEKQVKIKNVITDESITRKPIPQEIDFYQYCHSCFEGMHPLHGKLTMHVISSIAQVEKLNHDQAFALLNELNNSLRSLERNAHQPPHED